MIWQATILSWLLAAGAEAGGMSDLIVEGISRPAVDLRVRQMVPVNLAARGLIDPRQSTADFNSSSNSNTTFDWPTWNAQVSTACDMALGKPFKPSSPTGKAVCYNLPYMNMTSGVFMASLWIFQVNMPTGSFADIPLDGIQGLLSFKNASFMMLADGSGTPVANNSTNATIITPPTMPASDIQLLEMFTLMGQVNVEITSKMTMGDIQGMVMPEVTMTGNEPETGTLVKSILTANEASFLIGALAESAVISTTGAAQLAVNAEIAGLQNGTVAFVLPGYSFMLFPIGLTIYSFWLLIGLIAYGMGTFERMQYAHTYKLAARRTAGPGPGEM